MASRCNPSTPSVVIVCGNGRPSRSHSLDETGIRRCLNSRSYLVSEEAV